MDVYQLFLMLIKYFITYGKGNVSPITTDLKLIFGRVIIQLKTRTIQMVFLQRGMQAYLQI